MAGEPTLQYGDQSADGWVEFLQTELSGRGWPCGKDGTDGIDGDFGKHTLAAVKDFQAHYELTSQNGVVGSETWSVIRGEDEREAPGTDDTSGAGDYVEHGTRVRFDNSVKFNSNDGSLTLGAFSVGTEDPSSGSIELFLHLEDPTGDEYDVEAEHWADGDKQWFVVQKATAGRPDGTYSGVAQFPMEVGGEIWSFGFRKESLIDL